MLAGKLLKFSHKTLGADQHGHVMIHLLKGFVNVTPAQKTNGGRKKTIKLLSHVSEAKLLV